MCMNRALLVSLFICTLAATSCTDVPLTRCDFQPQALCVGTPGCVPDCDGRECGPDPECGFSCGACGPDSLCDDDAGQCAACDHDALCLGRECGEDGCGVLCGACGDGERCQDGGCVDVCVPACAARMCGDDGCGGACGTCPPGALCGPDGLCGYPGDHFCSPSPDGAPGCPGCPEGVEACVCAAHPECCTASWDANCVRLSWMNCGSGCEPESGCLGSIYGTGAQAYVVRPECGPDQFGRSCGACSPGERCHAGATCLPDYPDTAQPCGGDPDCTSGHCLLRGSGGVCTLPCVNAGQCPEGWVCDGGLLPQPWQGLCRPQEVCFPSCAAGSCGPDGCGGSCGDCPEGEACGPAGTCAPGVADPCAPAWGPPGCGGCTCEAAVCETEPACCLEAWTPYCAFLCGVESNQCGEATTCHPAGTPCTGCQVSDSPNCWDCPCQDCVCAADPHCCLKRWDDLCVLQCQLCGTDCPQ